MRNKIVKDDHLCFVEVESTIIERELVEKFLDVDEYDKIDNSLIRMEMNVIEFPIFSKDPKMKKNQALKYYFSKDQRSFLEITPPNNDTVPNEFDERVFISLLKVMKKKGNSSIFYCSSSEVVDSMNIFSEHARRKMYSRVKASVIKLSKTNYSFFNLFYRSKTNDRFEDLINTPLLTSMILTLKNADPSEKKMFVDGRTKELFRIRIADDIYNNIMNKGYLVFDADVLLTIQDPIVRSLYTQITKWRINDLYLKKPVYFIAHRIPLSWKGSMVYKSTKKIIECFEKSKELNLIADFNFIKGSSVATNEIDIFFNSEHNKYKQHMFYQDKEQFSSYIHSVEKRDSSILELDPVYSSEEDVFKIVEIFGEKNKRLITLPIVIEEALSKYDYDYVKYCAEYAVLNAKVSVLKYFKDTMANNWADEYIAKMKSRQEKIKIAEQPKEIIEEAQVVEKASENTEKFHSKNKFTYDDYEKMKKKDKALFEKEAYEYFLEVNDFQDNSLNKNIFGKAIKAYILDYLKSGRKTLLHKRKESDDFHELFLGDVDRRLREKGIPIAWENEDEDENEENDGVYQQAEIEVIDNIFEHIVDDTNYIEGMHYVNYGSIDEFVMDKFDVLEANIRNFDVEKFINFLNKVGKFKNDKIIISLLYLNETIPLLGYKLFKEDKENSFYNKK